MKEQLTLKEIAKTCHTVLTEIKSASLEKNRLYPLHRAYVKGTMDEAESDMQALAALCTENGMTIEVLGPREAIIDQNPTFVGTDCTPFGASF